jgi:hypothetical protein
MSGDDDGSGKEAQLDKGEESLRRCGRLQSVNGGNPTIGEEQAGDGLKAERRNADPLIAALEFLNTPDISFAESSGKDREGQDEMTTHPDGGAY